MSEINATLLREKFVIHDAMPSDMHDQEPIIALSNRLALPLVSKDGTQREEFVIRAQNMHLTARLGAQMAVGFQERGPLMGRASPFDWRYAYLAITKGFEKKWNPQHWVAVYHKGRVVFEAGEGVRHPFLDIIEQCDARNKDNYTKSMEIAKDAFRQAGKLVNIDHDSNVALVLNVKDTEGKCGVILRGPNKTTTFNLTAREKAGRKVKISQCLTVSAAFLEGIQLAFFIGMTKQKLKYELIGTGSDDALKCEDASRKLGRLNGAVSQFENMFDVTYRPDRPNLSEMITDAQEFARKILSSEIEAKIASGEDNGEWIV